jgi:hypothetical protein
LQVDAGGECKINIASTGSSGTADACGWSEKAAANGSALVQAAFSNAGSLPTYNTTVAENVAIEASTFTGTSINLQSVYVKITHPQQILRVRVCRADLSLHLKCAEIGFI